MTNTSTSPSRYTAFYLVMLILTSLGVGISVISMLISIPEMMRLLSFARGFVVCQIIISIATVTGVLALIFLWLKKNPLGIYLILGGYMAIILAGIATLFFLDPIIQDSTTAALKDSADLPAETVATITSFGTYTAYIISIVLNAAMVILWWFAYRNQKRADQEKADTK
jgi:uncharacterized membrane protein